MILNTPLIFALALALIADGVNAVDVKTDTTLRKKQPFLFDGTLNVSPGVNFTMVSNPLTLLSGHMYNKGIFDVFSDEKKPASVTILGEYENFGDIEFSSFDSNPVSTYNIDANGFINEGNLWIGTSGPSPIRLTSRAVWINSGAISLRQAKGNPSTVTITQSQGLIENDGSICLDHLLLQQAVNVQGSGCINVGPDAQLTLNPNSWSVDSSTNIYLSSFFSKIFVDGPLLLMKGEHTYNVKGFGGGNQITTKDPFSSFDYSGDTLTLNFGTGQLQFHFVIGPNYDPALFRTDEGDRSGKIITYEARVQNPVPEKCICAQFPSISPPKIHSSQVSSASSTHASSEISLQIHSSETGFLGTDGGITKTDENDSGRTAGGEQGSSHSFTETKLKVSQFGSNSLSQPTKTNSIGSGNTSPVTKSNENQSKDRVSEAAAGLPTLSGENGNPTKSTSFEHSSFISVFDTSINEIKSDLVNAQSSFGTTVTSQMNPSQSTLTNTLVSRLLITESKEDLNEDEMHSRKTVHSSTSQQSSLQSEINSRFLESSGITKSLGDESSNLKASLSAKDSNSAVILSSNYYSSNAATESKKEQKEQSTSISPSRTQEVVQKTEEPKKETSKLSSSTSVVTGSVSSNDLIDNEKTRSDQGINDTKTVSRSDSETPTDINSSVDSDRSKTLDSAASLTSSSDKQSSILVASSTIQETGLPVAATGVNTTNDFHGFSNLTISRFSTPTQSSTGVFTDSFKLNTLTKATGTFSKPGESKETTASDKNGKEGSGITSAPLTTKHMKPVETTQVSQATGSNPGQNSLNQGQNAKQDSSDKQGSDNNDVTSNTSKADGDSGSRENDELGHDKASENKKHSGNESSDENKTGLGSATTGAISSGNSSEGNSNGEEGEAHGGQDANVSADGNSSDSESSNDSLSSSQKNGVSSVGSSGSDSFKGDDDKSNDVSNSNGQSPASGNSTEDSQNNHDGSSKQSSQNSSLGNKSNSSNKNGTTGDNKNDAGSENSDVADDNSQEKDHNEGINQIETNGTHGGSSDTGFKVPKNGGGIGTPSGMRDNTQVPNQSKTASETISSTTSQKIGKITGEALTGGSDNTYSRNPEHESDGMKNSNLSSTQTLGSGIQTQSSTLETISMSSSSAPNSTSVGTKSSDCPECFVFEGAGVRLAARGTWLMGLAMLLFY